MSDAIVGIAMPKWGMTMTEGEVIEWLVSEGDEVTEGLELVEVETEKISGAVESPSTGVLRRILVQQGESSAVSTVLGVIAPAEVSDLEIEAFINASASNESVEEASDDTVSQEVSFLDFGSHRIRVRNVGSGASVLLLHGLGGDHSSWLFNQDNLSEHFQVYAPDLPAHGDSSLTITNGDVQEFADIIVALINDTIGDRVHLVGHSLGGSIAMEVALRRPDVVDSLSLIGPAGFGETLNNEYLSDFLSATRRKEMKTVLEYLFADSDSVTRLMVDSALQHRRLDGVLAQFGRIIEANFSRGEQLVEWKTRLKDLTPPAQIIWGREDRVFPVGSVLELGDSMPLHVIDNAGHMPQMERPTQVNQILQEFLRAG